MKIKDIKPGDKLIYFSIDRRFGYEVGINYNFGIEVEKVLKTKIKAKNGMEFNNVKARIPPPLQVVG